MPRIKKPKPDGEVVFQCSSCKGYGNRPYGVHGKNYKEYKCRMCNGTGWFVTNKLTKKEKEFWDEQTKIVNEYSKDILSSDKE